MKIPSNFYLFHAGLQYFRANDIILRMTWGEKKNKNRYVLARPQSLHKLNSWLMTSIINTTYGLSMFQFVDNLDAAALLFPPSGRHVIENN